MTTKRPNRYRLDPEYREKALARTRATHLANMHDEVYQELTRIRKLIWQRRESIDRMLQHVSKLEVDIIKLIRRRDQLAAERRARKERLPNG